MKLLLHQGCAYYTDHVKSREYGILVDGQFYDDIVNKMGFSFHYLYDVDNHAEDMPAVLVQTNYDQKKWETAESWETAYAMNLACEETGTTVIDTDWEAAGVSAEKL